jgi:hypothetical protein
MITNGYQFIAIFKGGVEFDPVNPGKNFRKCIFPEPGNFVVLIFQCPILHISVSGIKTVLVSTYFYSFW